MASTIYLQTSLPRSLASMLVQCVIGFWRTWGLLHGFTVSIYNVWMVSLDTRDNELQMTLKWRLERGRGRERERGKITWEYVCIYSKINSSYLDLKSKFGIKEPLSPFITSTCISVFYSNVFASFIFMCTKASCWLTDRSESSSAASFSMNCSHTTVQGH